MAFAVCISFHDNIAPPTGDEVYIKYVEFNGEDETQYKKGIKKLDKTLLFEHMRQKDPSFPEKLIAVSFNTKLTEKDKKKTFCEYVLRRGIYCDGSNSGWYRFLGHSDSHLWERKCYFMNASDTEIHDLLARFGDFAKTTNVRKRASEIGSLFVPFEHLVKLSEDNIGEEPDVKGRFFEKMPRPFTNGRGFMSPGFTLKVRPKLGVDHPAPSALQVSNQGLQGILVVRETLMNVSLVQFRKSMRLFSTPSKKDGEAIPFIGIVDHSASDVNGYLDSRLVMFLAIRGVSINHLRSLQNGYLTLLKSMCTNSASGNYFCQLTGRKATTEREVLASLQRGEVEEMLAQSFENANNGEPQRRRAVRTRILVPKARVVFGVGDPYGKLKKGECYFKPTLQNDEEFEELVVCPDPCYHPGDIQVLKLSQERLDYENLKDCLVLPVNHRHAFENSGASKFFVSWDQDLIPKQKRDTPCRYQSKRFEDVTTTVISWFQRIFHVLKKKKKYRDEMIHYFAFFEEDLPRRIGDVYMKFAETHGPYSKECTKLSKMNHQAANLMANSDDLSKELERLETLLQPRPPASVNYHSAERSPLLGGGGEEDVDDVHEDSAVSITTRIRRSLPGYQGKPASPQVWKEFDRESEKFVEEFYENSRI